MKRVIAFVNGPLGASALQMIGESLVGIVLNKPDKQRFTMPAIGHPVPVTEWGADTHEWIIGCEPTHGVSVMFGHIIPEETIRLFPNGIANLHTSLLPFGRGAHPNAWAIKERHPKGVTFHLMDSGVDTGPILAQCKIPSIDMENAKQLYDRLINIAAQMLPEWIEKFLNGELKPEPQMAHFQMPTRKPEELYQAMEIKPDSYMVAHDIVDTILAQTFPPYKGAIYKLNGKTYRLRLEVEEEK